jgi:hypothetical protein
MTAENRNSGTRERRPLLTNDPEIMYPILGNFTLLSGSCTRLQAVALKQYTFDYPGRVKSEFPRKISKINM